MIKRENNKCIPEVEVTEEETTEAITTTEETTEITETIKAEEMTTKCTKRKILEMIEITEAHSTKRNQEKEELMVEEEENKEMITEIEETIDQMIKKIQRLLLKKLQLNNSLIFL